MEDDVAYYSRRAAEESEAALCAVSAHARRVHRELADAYASHVRMIAAVERRSGFQLVSAA